MGDPEDRLRRAGEHHRYCLLIADTRSISFAYSYGMAFNNILADLQSGTRETASYIKSSEKVAVKSLEKMIKTFEGFDDTP